MTQVLLTLNSGSSSLKFSIFAIQENLLQRVFYGAVTYTDTTQQIKFSVQNDQHEILQEDSLKSNHDDFYSIALDHILNYLKTQCREYSIYGAGHRVVHGGDTFTSPMLVTAELISKLETLIPLAPLHLPHNIAGICALKKALPDIFQVVCFDTAFHTTQSPIAQAYALPDNLTSLPIKRYGFHGISYEYISQVAPHFLGQDAAKGKIIIAHLGQGASLCAIERQQSIASTMGFTALEGLPMGTRCGNIDPGIILYLLAQGMSAQAISDLLYKQSGLLGVSGISSDVRVLLASSETSAKKALDIFTYRIQREIGSLVAALNGLDSLIFTAGIGEHAAKIRTDICKNMEWLNLEIDEEANQKNALKISTTESKISVWVIPTNEELIIAQHTLALLAQFN